MLRALAKNGGVIQINFGSSFLTEESNVQAMKKFPIMGMYLELHGVRSDDETYRALNKAYDELHPQIYANLDEVLDHFDHVIEIAGIDHVGIGSDFDGVGDSLPVGLKDVSMYPNLIAGFLSRGYSEQDIEKILGGNLLRVWSDVEAYAADH
jgi:membrane dipeptidase